jgi:RNA polymerase sigma factor (sigma-70 family)
MAESGNLTRQIQVLVEQLRAGEVGARKELLNRASERMMVLTRKMLRNFPRVRRWEETGDVCQNASVRLFRTLAQVQPASAADFFRLAALNIRRELLDLAKHYYGALGVGANQASSGADGARLLAEPEQAEGEERLAAWAEFHRQVGLLPDEEREVFDLVWYQGLSQAEVGAMLNVSERTVKRRWQGARLQLQDALKGELPE